MEEGGREGGRGEGEREGGGRERGREGGCHLQQALLTVSLSSGHLHGGWPDGTVRTANEGDK